MSDRFTNSKIIHVVIGTGKMVHRAIRFENGDISSPLCGSGIHARKFCTTSRTRAVDDPVTCKRCDKWEAKS